MSGLFRAGRAIAEGATKAYRYAQKRSAQNAPRKKSPQKKPLTEGDEAMANVEEVTRKATERGIYFERTMRMKAERKQAKQQAEDRKARKAERNQTPEARAKMRSIFRDSVRDPVRDPVRSTTRNSRWGASRPHKMGAENAAREKGLRQRLQSQAGAPVSAAPKPVEVAKDTKDTKPVKVAKQVKNESIKYKKHSAPLPYAKVKKEPRSKLFIGEEAGYKLGGKPRMWE